MYSIEAFDFNGGRKSSEHPIEKNYISTELMSSCASFMYLQNQTTHERNEGSEAFSFNVFDLVLQPNANI